MQDDRKWLVSYSGAFRAFLVTLNNEENLMRRYLVLVLLAALLVPVFSFAQETATERKPSGILQAEQAGILLMPARVDLEQPEKSLDALGLEEGDLVVDMGCGNGFYTLRLAERVGPHGHVLAVDIQQGMIDQLVTRMTDAGIKNIYPILGTHDDPPIRELS